MSPVLISRDDLHETSQNTENHPMDVAFPVISKEALRKEISRATARIEERFLDALMAHCGGNVTAAAKASGIHRSHLQRMLARRGPTPPIGGAAHHERPARGPFGV